MKKEKNKMRFIEVESKSVSEKGEIVFYATTFGNVDSHKDVVTKAAVSRTLTEFKAGLIEIALLQDHNQNIYIGQVVGLDIDDIGLKVTGMINLQTKEGRDVYENAKFKASIGKSLKWSIGYYTLASKERDGDIRELVDIEIKEISAISFIPSNEKAVTLSIKSESGIVDIEKTLLELKKVLEKRENIKKDDYITLSKKIKDLQTELESKKDSQSGTSLKRLILLNLND